MGQEEQSTPSGHEVGAHEQSKNMSKGRHRDSRTLVRAGTL